jgi:hypothetical protein
MDGRKWKRPKRPLGMVRAGPGLETVAWTEDVIESLK